ncbi:hypothetical protein B4907_18445 [Yersinia kristensenii]|nr:hypothetical protein B4907_18445 [Yersinia kristensenii]
MAKTPSKQQASMNELGGLPPEFEVDTQQSVPDVQKETSTSEEPPEISDDQNKVSGETETQGKTTESELESDAPDEMELVVVKGQTVRHSGETYAENSYLYLPHDAAKRLIKLGVVADVKALRHLSASTIGPSITVDDGVKINRGG